MSEEQNQENQDKGPEPKKYDLSKISDMVGIFRDDVPEDQIKIAVSDHIGALLDKYSLGNYRVIFLFDDNRSIGEFHSNRIYQAISDLNNEEDILLVLQSGGGKIEPAYLISKTCRRLCKSNFAITIPRKAKSAATLISLGASELHMGLLSELGPIDPQFSGFPASGLANAMEKIAEMACKFPESSDMLAKYLTDNLNIRDLGYFERINESAVQYAERLLKGKRLPDNWSESSLANHLTNHYKDHGFVIDSDEACSLLGEAVVKENTTEYQFGNEVYEFLDFIGFLYKHFKSKEMAYVGSVAFGLDLNDIEKRK